MFFPIFVLCHFCQIHLQSHIIVVLWNRLQKGPVNTLEKFVSTVTTKLLIELQRDGNVDQVLVVSRVGICHAILDTVKIGQGDANGLGLVTILRGKR